MNERATIPPPDAGFNDMRHKSRFSRFAVGRRAVSHGNQPRNRQCPDRHEIVAPHSRKSPRFFAHSLVSEAEIQLALPQIQLLLSRRSTSSLIRPSLRERSPSFSAIRAQPQRTSCQWNQFHHRIRARLAFSSQGPRFVPFTEAQLHLQPSGSPEGAARWVRLLPASNRR